MLFDDALPLFRSEIASAELEHIDLVWFDNEVFRGEEIYACIAMYELARPQGFRLSREVHAAFVEEFGGYFDFEHSEEVFSDEIRMYRNLITDGSAPVAA